MRVAITRPTQKLGCLRPPTTPTFLGILRTVEAVLVRLLRHDTSEITVGLRRIQVSYEAKAKSSVTFQTTCRSIGQNPAESEEFYDCRCCC